MKNKISAFIITKNEEKVIERCIKSIKDFVDEIIIVDSYSTDKTIKIAKEFKAKVFLKKFENDYAKQKNYAISKCKGKWIFTLDADEVASFELVKNLRRLTKQKTFSAYLVKRINYWKDKPIKYGPYSKDYVIRLFKKSKTYYKYKVHEEVIVKGKTKKIEFPIHHVHLFNNYSLSAFRKKWKKYAKMRAELIIEEFYREIKRTPLRSAFSYFYSAFYIFFNLFFKGYIKDKGYKEGFVGLQTTLQFSLSAFFERLYVTKLLINYYLKNKF